MIHSTPRILQAISIMLDAADFIDPQGQVPGGQRLAQAVVGLLEEHGDVRVSFKKMPPLSSSYFNIVLLTLAEKVGWERTARIPF